eukprot:66353_1
MQGDYAELVVEEEDAKEYNGQHRTSTLSGISRNKPRGVSLIGISADAATIEFETGKDEQKTWTSEHLQTEEQVEIDGISILLSSQLHGNLSFSEILQMAATFFITKVYAWAVCVAFILSALSLILVSVPFGTKPYDDKDLNIKHMYFDYKLVLYGTTLPTLMIGIFVATGIVSAWLRTYVRWYDIGVALSTALCVLVFCAMIPPIWFDVRYYWYALEANISCAFFLITVCYVSLFISKLRVNSIEDKTGDYTFKQLFKYSILPIMCTSIIFSFTFQQLDAIYLEATVGYKILIRGVLWPIFNNTLLGVAEYWSYHVGSKKYKKLRANAVNEDFIDTEEEIIDIERRNHGLYNLQVGFFLVGRVWISYIETIEDVVIICMIQSFFDIVIHRASRPLNMLFTHLFLKNTKEKSTCNKILTRWRAIFNNEKLLLYRAVIINAEYVADTACILSNAMFIIVMILTKDWHYNNLVWNIPDITVTHMIEFAIVQLLFNMLTHIVTGTFDIKYGKINLMAPWKRRIWTQYISELAAFIGMSFFGSYYLYRQLPNYIQCTSTHDVCSCDFTDAKWGC